MSWARYWPTPKKLSDSYPLICMPWGQDVAQGHIDALNYAKARPEGGVSKFNLGTVKPRTQQFAEEPPRIYTLWTMDTCRHPPSRNTRPGSCSHVCCYIKSPLNH
jgi:hypothetical protein